jgi:hypothetical protein
VRHTPSRTSFRTLAAIGVAALTLAACGGGDDEASPATTTADAAVTSTTTVTTPPSASAATTGAPSEGTTATSPATSAEAPSTTSVDELGDGGEDDDVVIVDDVSELPPECVDLLADFLKVIEPAVSDIDWDTATLGDFQAISDDLEGQFEEMDARELELGCDNYDLSSDQASMEAAIAIAEEQAPGTVGWLEFIASLSADMSTEADPSLDCEGAIAYIDGLIAEGSTMTDVPFSEVSRITQALGVITSDCTPEQADEFLAREDVTDFLS